MARRDALVHQTLLMTGMAALLFLAVAGLGIWWAFPPATDEFPESIVAIIDTEPLLRESVEARIIETFPEERPDVPFMESKLPRFSRYLVRERLLLSEARQRQLTVSEHNLTLLATALAAAPSSERPTDGKASPNMQRLRADVLVEKARRAVAAGRYEITEDDIRGYYQRHLDDMILPGYRIVRRIVVREHKLAREIRNSVVHGYEMAILAEEHSITPEAANGGLLPPISNAGVAYIQYGPIYEDMDVGQLSPVIETPLGYQLFYLEEYVPDKPPQLEEVRDTILEKLRNRARRDRVERWLAEQEASGRVQWNPRYLPVDAVTRPLPGGIQ